MENILIPKVIIFFQIVFIDIVMAADNAIIIGLIASSFASKDRKRIILLGVFGAFIFRVIFAAITVQLLQFPILKIVGGALLIWIVIKLIKDLELIDALKTTSILNQNINTIKKNNDEFINFDPTEFYKRLKKNDLQSDKIVMVDDTEETHVYDYNTNQWSLVSNNYSGINDYGKAIMHFSNAMRLSKGDSLSRYNLLIAEGHALYKKGKKNGMIIKSMKLKKKSKLSKKWKI